MMNDNVIKDLFEVVTDRKTNPSENSYTCYLFSQGINKILKKVGEESAETIIAAKEDDKEALTGEVCDLIYHLIVMAVEKGISADMILEELDKRSQKIGNLKVMKKTDKQT
jgi:phosphoribosyl-ATP pyrophosphohydrolase